ncbi:aldehyde dehydrogenase family protein [Streptomyces sp. SID4919]|uniref:aldehyde dehydrogenase family protein n=1 Tax=unclassified Streptomyces TaxID=2593676 RepID=UPI000823EDC2|nr:MULTISPECIES: aldehyde dehydrogenase family protein [unclassified Streptomyces]MYY13870.1 aldehyde dehydrogenase family protein [Streptomyces sp. SID4919]SCK31115.1 aldehyde dehydrogenase (NAD(P)+) [Streptomyces sp. AmelKG-E11A]
MTTSAPAADRLAEADRAVADLVRGESAWAACGLARRRELLERVHTAAGEHAAAWVRAAAAYKRLPDDSPLIGEEWITGPYPVLTGTGALAASIRALEAGRSPVDAFTTRPAPGGRVAVRVLPHSVYDRLLLSGFSADVWMSPGVTTDEIRDRAGLALRRPKETGGVGVVLGAGNITSIPVLDVLYELYAHNRVVVLKLNPVTDGLLTVFRAVLAPLIDVGAVRVLTGGADIGTHLVHHPDVGHVHMTGSAVTHDAIVFGTGTAGADRKRAGTPLLDKPVTSELGGVSPTLVLPGNWSDADLRFQAEHVATQRLHNGGYNCVASQVVVLSSGWAQKDRFLAHLRAALAKAPARPAYYPGSDHRVAQALTEYAGARRIGDRVLIEDLDARDPGPALTTEYFAPVLGVLELPGDPATFLDDAVTTANERFAGTLGVNLIAHPRTLAALGPALDEAIARLRYGTVAVNAWTGVGYLTATASWGAFPGHTVDDVQSGIGVVHNALLLDGPERTVVRGPFRPAPRSLLHGEPSLSPKPPWFVTNRTAATTGRLLSGFAAAPRWTALPGIFASALRG